MKRILLFTALFVFLVEAYAQQNSSIKYGVKAGVNRPQIQMQFSGMDEVTYTSDVSFNMFVGGYLSLPISKIFAIEPGVFLQGKGGKIQVDEWWYSNDETTNLSIFSLEIPINAMFYIPTGRIGSVFIGLGPYIGYNLFGKERMGNLSYKLDFGAEESQFRQLDYGLNGLVGYRFNHGLLINVGYGLGLADLDNFKKTDLGFSVLDLKTTNRVLSFGVGFLL